MQPNPPQPTKPDKLLSWRQVHARVGISRTTAWRWAKDGRFVRPIKLAPGLHRWRESEIDLWISAREVGQ